MMPRRIGGWRIGLVLAAIVFVAGLGVLVWHLAPWSDSGFVERRMPVKTDIPTALAVAPDGAVWFTIEFSDAIGVFRNGKVDRFLKGTQNLEPLGLAADAEGGAWYTDTPMRAISRISATDNYRSFPL
jgi:virginiamycin B lyase